MLRRQPNPMVMRAKAPAHELAGIDVERATMHGVNGLRQRARRDGPSVGEGIVTGDEVTIVESAVRLDGWGVDESSSIESRSTSRDSLTEVFSFPIEPHLRDEDRARVIEAMLQAVSDLPGSTGE